MAREEAIKWFEGEKEAAERQVVAFESCFKCFKSAHRKIVAYNEMAISALREQPRWISVEERLPEYNADVLVYRPNMAMKFLVDSYDGYYGEDDGEWYEGWNAYGKDIHGNSVITHWMPLPKPPTEEEV